MLGARSFPQDGAGLAGMAEWILAVTGARPEEVAVAIETPHGPVVESLMARGFRLHAINPKQLDRFRDRFSPAGAKDERRDDAVLASALRPDPQCLRSAERREGNECVRHGRSVCELLSKKKKKN